MQSRLFATRSYEIRYGRPFVCMYFIRARLSLATLRVASSQALPALKVALDDESRAVVVNSNMSRGKYLAREGPGSRLHFEPLCIVYAGHARRWPAYTWTMEQPCPSCLSDSSKAYLYSYSLLRRLSFPYLHTERVTTKYYSSSSSSSSSFSSSPSFQLILIFLYLFYFILFMYIFCFCFHLLCLIFSGLMQTGYTSFFLFLFALRSFFGKQSMQKQYTNCSLYSHHGDER